MTPESPELFLAWLRERTYSPTVREVATHWDVAPSTAHERLIALREQGVVSFEDGRARTLRPAN